MPKTVKAVSLWNHTQHFMTTQFFSSFFVSFQFSLCKFCFVFSFVFSFWQLECDLSHHTTTFSFWFWQIRMYEMVNMSFYFFLFIWVFLMGIFLITFGFEYVFSFRKNRLVRLFDLNEKKKGFLMKLMIFNEIHAFLRHSLR